MAGLTTAPVLSTPDDLMGRGMAALTVSTTPLPSDEQMAVRYEIDRTLREIREHKWQRVALQFPDSMLGHSAKVYHLLDRGLHAGSSARRPHNGQTSVADNVEAPVKLTILGDTSYGSCCVDEIAAEHVNADAVVHYGRSCLSPTARLPVIYVFTRSDLDEEKVVSAFTRAYPERSSQVIVTADTAFADYITRIVERLRTTAGYTNCFPAEITHNPSSVIPNRTVPPELATTNSDKLQDWSLFHIGEPPTALLLTLASRVKNIHIFNPDSEDSTSQEANTALLLRRRYALVTSMSSASTWGILINTLSVKNYLHIVSHIKRTIAAAGKKSYLFVVGKLNTAKMANFADIDGWVVIGCWESSLIDSRDFYKPLITPFELDLALKKDEERVWSGAWRSDFQGVLDEAALRLEQGSSPGGINGDGGGIGKHEAGEHDGSHLSNHSDDGGDNYNNDDDDDEESEPPDFDLRTGKYTPRSRPARKSRIRQPNAGTIQHPPTNTSTRAHIDNPPQSQSLAKRPNTSTALLAVNGLHSPAAEYLAQKRSWTGLGSDFAVRDHNEGDVGDEGVVGAVVEEGRSGVAGGYILAYTDGEGESERR